MQPPTDIGRTLCWGIDAVSFAEDRLDFTPDPWQARFLRSRSRWILLNCCRQSGKSTVTAITALHTAIYEPESLVLCVSPSLRQSRELFTKIIGFLRRLEPVVPLEEDNKSSCELRNGSRLVSLPGDPATVRGYSAPRLVLLDEAGYIADEMMAAISPMLAVSQGRQIEMSSPNGRRGFFYQNWTYGEGVERIKVTAQECPRISAKFLASERKKLGTTKFDQEYGCAFNDTDTSAFATELIELALTDEFEPFLQPAQ